MKITNIPYNIQDYISYQELSEIQSRINKVPNVDFNLKNNSIYLDDKKFLECYLPGSEQFFLHCIKDINLLIQHVINAEEVNKKLEEEIKELKKQG